MAYGRIYSTVINNENRTKYCLMTYFGKVSDTLANVLAKLNINEAFLPEC